MRAAAPLLCALLLAAPSARADDPAAARSLKSAADEAFVQGDFERALRLLEKAYAAHPEPSYIANQGLVLEKMGRYADAVTALERFLANEPDLSRAEAAEKVIHRLKPWLRVTSEPSGAAVRLDGAALGRTPLQERVLVGHHTLVIEQQGFDAVTRSIEVVAGSAQPVEVRLVATTVRPVTRVEPIRPAEPWSPPVRARRDLRLWAYVAWGGAVVAGGAAGALYGLGLQAIDARDGADSAAQWDEENDRAATMQTGVVAAGATAGALAIGGAVLFLLHQPEGVALTPTGRGAALTLTF